MRKRLMEVVSGAALLLSTPSFAVDADLESKFSAAMELFAPGAVIEDIVLDKNTGLYLLISEKGGTVYINEKADRIFVGSLAQIKDGQVTNKTAEALIERAINSSKDGMIEYKSKIEEKGVVTVFFDVSCSYCRVLHRSIEELNSYGITVRYLAYPRAGLASNDAQIMRGIWCRNDAARQLNQYLEGYLTDAELKKVADTPNNCGRDVVEEGYYLGKSVGIKGTPALMFESLMLRNFAMKPSKIYEEALKGR